jgi:hypothetical protein
MWSWDVAVFFQFWCLMMVWQLPAGAGIASLSWFCAVLVVAVMGSLTVQPLPFWVWEMGGA